MLVKEGLENLKSDFLTKNAAFVKAVKHTTNDNVGNMSNQMLLTGLRLEALQSYELILEHMRI